MNGRDNVGSGGLSKIVELTYEGLVVEVELITLIERLGCNVCMKVF